MKIDPAAMGFMSPSRVFRAAFKAVDALQDEPPAVQVAALSMLFVLLCAQRGVNPANQLSRIERLLADYSHMETAEAVKQYIAKELS